MRVKTLRTIDMGGGIVSAGVELTVPPSVAADWLANGWAVEVPRDGAPETVKAPGEAPLALSGKLPRL